MGGPLMVVTGFALVLDKRLSFYGGLDPATGEITDPLHPNYGARINGQILVVEATKGSSCNAGVLAENIRCGMGPAAIILREPSLDIAIGTLTPEVLYGIQTPYAVLDIDTFDHLRTGDRLQVSTDGLVKRLS